MPGRSFSANGYRYGFNGKEKDDEVKEVDGTQYDYGFRIYDPRIAKFLSVDPLFQSYPWYTPYQFAGNNPIRYIDIDGLEEGDPIPEAYYRDQPKINMTLAPQSSPRTAEGVQRNARWYWKQRLAANPEMFDVDNQARILAGTSPVVNETWVNNGNPTHKKFMGQTLHHHHVNQGEMAVALPKKVHEKWSKILHNKYVGGNGGLRGIGQIKASLGKMKSALSITGIFLDAKGAYDGDPHNTITQFEQITGGAKQNKVYYDAGSESYVVATAIADFTEVPTEGPHQGWSRVVYMDQYADYAWDDNEKKYIGVGLLARGYQIHYANGSFKTVETECYRDDNECSYQMAIFTKKIK